MVVSGHACSELSVSPLEVVDKLGDQAEQLLRVLVGSFAESDLEERKTGKSATVLSNSVLL